jgi:hypothetical protein
MYVPFTFLCRPAGLPAMLTGSELPNEPLRLPQVNSCSKCLAHKFAYESLGFCCGDGQVQLAANEYPPELVRLYTSTDEQSVHF